MRELFLTSGEFARRINRSVGRVRQLDREGAIRAEFVTTTGTRLYTEAEVERFLRERNKSVAGGTAA